MKKKLYSGSSTTGVEKSLGKINCTVILKINGKDYSVNYNNKTTYSVDYENSIVSLPSDDFAFWIHLTFLNESHKENWTFLSNDEIRNSLGISESRSNEWIAMMLGKLEDSQIIKIEYFTNDLAFNYRKITFYDFGSWGYEIL